MSDTKDYLFDEERMHYDKEIANLKSQLSSTLSRSSAYGEALGTIASMPDWPASDMRVVARRALDRKPEEPVGREVSREELAKAICDTYYYWPNFSEQSRKIADHLLKTFRVGRR